LSFLFAFILILVIPSAHAESKIQAYIAPKAGFTLFKPTDLSMGAGILLGAEAGYRVSNWGHVSLGITTATYDSDTQMTYYLLGFSREIIWNIAVTANLGLQSMFDHELAAGLTRQPSPTGTQFTYGIGISYLTTPVLTFRPDIELQIIPEAVFYRTTFINWYGASVHFRFNFLNP
jgi:hypothetical protein